MNRYIEADALNKAFSKLRFNDNGELKHYGDRSNWILWGSEIETLILEAPSIDIVRCKECKWAEPNREGDLNCKCHIPIFRVSADDYCSYGEREGE